MLIFGTELCNLNNCLYVFASYIIFVSKPKNLYVFYSFVQACVTYSKYVNKKRYAFLRERL